MSRSIAPFVGACVLAAGAGVAIAGVPRSSASETLEIVSTTTSTTSTTTSTSTTVPITTVPAVPDTTVPAVPDTTVAPDTTAAPSTSDAAAAPLTLLVLNGEGTAGLAGRGAELLESLGFAPPDVADTNESVELSGIFYRAGLEVEALSLKEQLGYNFLTVASQDQLPAHSRPGEWDLVLVLGADYAQVLGE